MKRKYVDILTQGELDHLHQDIEGLQEENRRLKEDNEHLSSIIHKDNKLMRALLAKTHEALETVVPEENIEERKKLTEQLLEQLDAEAGERAEKLRSYEHSGKVLPKVGIEKIDLALSSYDQQTFAEGIQYDVTVDPQFSETIQKKISMEDFSTLLYDFLENALIATRPQENKKILVALTISDNRAKIAVCDSGVPFPQEVKDDWGIRRHTTHGDEGGSGIGMMSTYQLCQKYAADFQIEEYPPDMPYTKCISVTFPQ